jgi:hypothetical protein
MMVRDKATDNALLSNNTVRLRITDVAENVKLQLSRPRDVTMHYKPMNLQELWS